MLPKFAPLLSELKTKKTVWIGGGIGIIAAGVIGAVLWSNLAKNSSPQAEGNRFSQILQAPEPEKITALEKLTKSGTKLEQTQARYLLAVNALNKNDPKAAINWLNNLTEKDSPLAAPILVLQAQAYTQAQQPEAAETTWQKLLTEFPQEPEAATALIALNKPDQAIAQFPQVPAVVELAQKRLQDNPKQLPLMRLIAHYGLYLPNYVDVLDRLTKDYRQQLTPDDWAAIGFGYWEKLAYKKAGLAYLNAPKTAFNRYRAGRALQLGNEKQQAITLYQQVVQEFPQTKEAGLAWLRLGRLSQDKAQALTYFQNAITTATQANYPTIAADALLDRAGLFDQIGNTPQAAEARETLLSTYATTPAAGHLRWQQAQRDAQAKNLEDARTWAKSLLKHNPDSELAPTAAFWLGRWAKDERERNQDWQILLEKYPFSYYTWRALSLMGKPVGDFTTVRAKNPSLDLSRRQVLPLITGSATLKALYDMGQANQAWSRWQWEYRNRVEPTASEQLTDGLVRLGVGDFLDGIFMLENLQQRARTEPATAAFFAPIQADPAYWYALYPLPFWPQVQAWSAKRQINPLLVMSLIRQESRFEVGIQSVVGATGLMQVMPDTAAWIAPQINLKTYRLNNVDDSLNLGTWYFAHTHDLHDQNTLLALASYNAGPGNVEDWLKRFGYQDPDQFIEQIPFPETYGYVKSIFGNYWNYLRLYGHV